MNTSFQGSYIMHAQVLLCITHHTSFKVPSFNNSKTYDWGQIKKNGSRDHMI